MSRWRRRNAYYGGNYGSEYSRSRRAEEAEQAGRYPKTRAAAAMGVSVAAFEAGCAAMNYRTNEWHHVGRYATMVDYWDTELCARSWEFWKGAAGAYKAKAKRLALEAKARELRREEFKAKLEAQRDCSRPVRSCGGGRYNWERFVRTTAEKAGIESYQAPTHIEPGDMSYLTAYLAAMKLQARAT